jgi:hypothetical protein
LQKSMTEAFYNLYYLPWYIKAIKWRRVKYVVFMEEMGNSYGVSGQEREEKKQHRDYSYTSTRECNIEASLNEKEAQLCEWATRRYGPEDGILFSHLRVN